MTTHARWLSAFIDVPVDRFDAAAAFWTAATETSLSEPRGEDQQYFTLLPDKADAYLRLQRHDGEPRIHLDMHVESIPEARQRVLDLGGRVVEDRGYAIVASPGGFEFCLVNHHGENDSGSPPSEPVPHRLDVVVLDAPAPVSDAEVTFWTELVGHQGEVKPGFEEYVSFPLREHGLPLNMLVQRLGDDGRTRVHGHLDISAGREFRSVVERHVELGATIEHEVKHWTVMRDPAGVAYCVTGRNPD